MFLSALEKSKLVYLLSRGSNQEVLLSAPIEADVPGSLCFGVEGIAVGNDNPAFVSIENKTGEQTLSIIKYVLDLGLNGLVREKVVPLTGRPRFVLPLLSDDPEVGFYLAYDRRVEFYSRRCELLSTAHVPRRVDNPKDKRSYNLVASTNFRNKEFGFFLLQNCVGDFFKVGYPSGSEVRIDYLFTGKIATGFCIFKKTGHMFVANEASAHRLYTVKSLDPDPLQNRDLYVPISLENSKCLELQASFSNYAGIVDVKYEDLLGDEIGQNYVLSSGVNGSFLRALSSQVAYEELASHAMPQNRPKQLWALQNLGGDVKSSTKYLVMSFHAKTRVLNAGQNIKDAEDKMGFALDRESIWVGQIERAEQVTGYIQVTPEEIRVISSDRKAHDFKIEQGKKIVRACQWNHDVLLYLSSGELVTMREDHSSLAETGRGTINAEPVALALNKGLAVLSCNDSTIKVYMNIERVLVQRYVQVTKSVADSLILVRNKLMAGLSNGQMFIASVDYEGEVGTLSLPRTEDLRETKPLRLFKVALADKNWICGSSNKSFFLEEGSVDLRLRPLLLKDQIKSMCVMRTVNEHDLVLITEAGSLLIIHPRELDKPFSVKELSMPIMGRKFLINRENLSLIVVNSQCATLSPKRKEQKIEKLQESIAQNREAANGGQRPLDASLLHFNPKESHWQSAIYFVTPKHLNVQYQLEFPDNQHIVDAAICEFKEVNNASFLLVSVIENHVIEDNSFTGTFIEIYSLETDPKKIKKVHTTQMDYPAYSLCSFKERLIAGCGPYLRLYELGKKQLLKKNEYKQKFTLIAFLRSANARIFVGDAASSVHMMKYNENDSVSHNLLQEVADDILPRYLTSLEVVDYNTLAITDKFGTLSILRIPLGVEEDIQDDYATYDLKWETGYLNGAPVKFEQICCFFTGTVMSSVRKVAMGKGGEEMLMTASFDGSIHVFIPFKFKSDLDFFRHLELSLRNREKGYKNLTDRDHLIFRSYYGAVRGIIDGDLCD